MAMALAFGVAAVVGLASGALIDNAQGRLPVSVTVGIIAALIGLAFLATLPWWQRIDDMERGGHLSSWYWGGQFGGLLALLALVVTYGRDHQLVYGGLIILAAEVAGFLLVLAGWKIAHRGAPE
jgi:hypothetical protein